MMVVKTHQKFCYNLFVVVVVVVDESWIMSPLNCRCRFCLLETLMLDDDKDHLKPFISVGVL